MSTLQFVLLKALIIVPKAGHLYKSRTHKTCLCRHLAVVTCAECWELSHNSRAARQRPLDPLFITGNCQVLDIYYFLSKVKHVLQLIGYDPNRYNGPSFRSGAATSASKVRMEDHLIKTLGRWSSESYCRYIKTSTSTIKNAQKSLMFQ